MKVVIAPDIRATHRRRSRAGIKKTVAVYTLLLPGLVYFLINNYAPMVGIIMAFKKLNFRVGIFASEWAGFDNFRYIFTSGRAWIITLNTLLYNIVFLTLGTVLPMSVAILLNEVQKRSAARVYQTVILFPFLMSWVIVSYLVFAFLGMETGYFNTSVLPALGLDPINFYQDKTWWPLILTLANLWKSLGFNMVIYYAAVVGISQEYYEAARLDGAGKWQQIRHITLPGLKPTAITLFILGIGRVFYSDFGLFYQVPRNSGMLYNVTQTIDTFVYNALMVQSNLGMSSATGLYQSVLGCIFVVAANALVRKLDAENAIF